MNDVNSFQGGQYVLELVDYFGGTFLILFCAIVEVITVFWIYGEWPVSLPCYKTIVAINKIYLSIYIKFFSLLHSWAEV